MRYAARVDENQGRIVKALRAVGAWVWSTAPLGNGFPDLLVWFRGQYTLLEVKREGPPSAQKLTEAESKFALGCPGRLEIVTTAEEALRAIGAIEHDTPKALKKRVSHALDAWEADRARRAGGGK